ncbi:hypothetical protein [Deinococcus pimensis]|uniref:hypothetical protein n=1 Tax=Deinococcus pimensis TaxID=309888 RepID=UPI00047F863F|nr:hypothetical protein [Deinococcus pimensis]
MPDFGTDLQTRPFTGAHVSGLDNLRAAVARRLMTPIGGLFYDPSYGSSLLDYLGEGVENANELAATLEVELEEDPRIRDATITPVDVTLRRVTFDVHLETALGPFDLVVSADLAQGALTPTVEVSAAYGVG